MKKLISLILLLPYFVGCSSIQPGSDPLTVRAEQTAQIAFSTFDALFNLEYDNREWLDENKPEIKELVNKLREYAPTGLKALRSATKEYKQLSSDTNRSKLQNVIAAVVEAMTTANQLIAEIESREQ